MPIALFAALAGSLAIHVAALFGTDAELFGSDPEPVTLQAEIRPLPPAPPVEVAKPAIKPVQPKPGRSSQTKKTSMQSHAKAAPAGADVAPLIPEMTPELPSTLAVTPVVPPSVPAKPILPASGSIRFAIYKESLGLQVGRAEHHWAFSEDGRYRLTGMTETSGLAALFKPVRIEIESSGRLVAGGLQPETLRSWKNGQDTNENADFSWSTAVVSLSRDGSVQSMAPGTQDILSLNYQLAYLRRPEDGATVGVVTGKKYDRFALDSLGEEEIDIAAGHFRTLHLRATGDTVTEIWIALDRHRLPVKIRYTDKKGDIFEQVATEIGSP